MCRIVWLFNNSPRRPYGAPCSSYWCQNSVKENWLKCHSPIRFGTNSRTFSDFSDFSDIFTSAWYPWSGRLRVRSSVFLERISFYTGWGRGEDALLGRERSGRNHVEQHGGRSGGGALSCLSPATSVLQGSTFYTTTWIFFTSWRSPSAIAGLTMNCARIPTMISPRLILRPFVVTRELHRCSCVYRSLYVQKHKQENTWRRPSYMRFCTEIRQQYPVCILSIWS